MSKRDVSTDDNPAYGVSASHKRCTETAKDYEIPESSLAAQQEAVYQRVFWYIQNVYNNSDQRHVYLSTCKMLALRILYWCVFYDYSYNKSLITVWQQIFISSHTWRKLTSSLFNTQLT